MQSKVVGVARPKRSSKLVRQGLFEFVELALIRLLAMASHK